VTRWIKYPLLYCWFFVAFTLVHWIGVSIGAWRLDHLWAAYFIKPLVGLAVWFLYNRWKNRKGSEEEADRSQRKPPQTIKVN
jgi:hypothetical protein